MADQAQRPTLGRIVHWRAYYGGIYPAIITGTYDGDPTLVCLEVFGIEDADDLSERFKTSVPMVEPSQGDELVEDKQGWFWPPRL
jgi:hypothetical protein